MYLFKLNTILADLLVVQFEEIEATPTLYLD